ncbi:MAG: hypothetical protein V1800_03545 [Candidatus Latescibacterota bacterium]
MRGRTMSCLLSFLLLIGQSVVFSQTAAWHGQGSGWLSGNPGPLISQAGFRYIPNLSIEKKINSHLVADAEISLNTYALGNFENGENREMESALRPYRLWVRVAGNQFDARVGLQKINFGSATLFRPLRWFDRIDPRDPLKFTDGVYGLLVRYYFQKNAAIWLWGLRGNQKLKGWETAPTEDHGLEFGGHLQVPLFTGEAGITYHHRRADFSRVPALSAVSEEASVDESRFALDGKWDIGIGLWFEGSLIQRDTSIPSMKYQRMGTVGADYTVGMGNGLYVLTEFFRSENSSDLFGAGDGIQSSGSSISYPIGLFDRVSGIHYYDWTNARHYILLDWQRIYDSFSFHVIGFSNPETVRLHQMEAGSKGFSGNGFQVMVVFDH